MNLLDTLTRAADEEQLRLRPLPDHAAASQPEHLRRHYALLLAAVLTAQPTISEPQTRLLCLLLDALKLGDLRGTLFEQARDLTPEPLLEAARLIREAGFAHHLVLDALVLLRLDAPLGDEAARLVGELAAFFGLDESQLTTRAADAFEILGLDGGEYRTDAEDTDAPRPLLLAEIWPGRLRQPLTREVLRSGLQGGLWLLDANLDVDFPWQAHDALLFFKNGATLNTFAKEGEVKLAGCRLFNAVLDFQGACSIALERCDWQGNYDPAAKRTALHSNSQALTVTDCTFSTRNAQTLAVIKANLEVNGCSFFSCGNPEVNGGAIFWDGGENKRESWISSGSIYIEFSKFIRCMSNLGGAIYLPQIEQYMNISNSEFYSCRSMKIKELGRDIAVFSVGTMNCHAISNSSFREASIYLGDVRDHSSGEFAVKKTQFCNGNIYLKKSGKYRIQNECSFLEGDVIFKDFS